MSEKDNDSRSFILRGLSIAAVVFIFYSLGLIPVFLVGKIIFTFFNFGALLNLFIMPFFVVFIFFVFLLSEIIITSSMINLFNLKYEEGIYDLNLKDKMFYKFTVCSLTYLPLNMAMGLLSLTPLCQLQAKLMGAKIGKNVLLVGRINDPCLTEIGDNSVIGGLSIIAAHAGEQKLILKKVKIGNNCVVGGSAHIMPGVTMEDYSTLGAMGLATKNQVLEKGKKYGGIPAREIKKSKSKV
jgi:hypothetical protein